MDFSALTSSFSLVTFGEIMFANIVLSGDNAVLIGLAASGLPPQQRARAILFGMLFATVLRVVFSIFAVYLLEVPGLLLVGGLLLLWIAWGFYGELRGEKDEEENPEDAAGGIEKTMAQALRQIVIADVSMSLDNVLAIAGIARGNFPMLILGLAVSIALMGVAASIIARLLARYRWIAYIGVALIAWIGIEMTYEGGHQLYGWMKGEQHEPAPAARHGGLLPPAAAAAVARASG